MRLIWLADLCKLQYYLEYENGNSKCSNNTTEMKGDYIYSKEKNENE